MRCVTIDRPTSRRARLGSAVWIGGLFLCAATAQAAEGVVPSSCPDHQAVPPAGDSLTQPPPVVEQALPAGCARPTDRERSEAPRTPERRRVPRIRDAPDTMPGGSIAPPDPRVLPA